MLQVLVPCTLTPTDFHEELRLWGTMRFEKSRVLGSNSHAHSDENTHIVRDSLTSCITIDSLEHLLKFHIQIELPV